MANVDLVYALTSFRRVPSILSTSKSVFVTGFKAILRILPHGCCQYNQGTTDPLSLTAWHRHGVLAHAFRKAGGKQRTHETRIIYTHDLGDDLILLVEQGIVHLGATVHRRIRKPHLITCRFMSSLAYIAI